MTPVGGFAALVVDRSPEPESSAADQDRHLVELLAEGLVWARRENPQIADQLPVAVEDRTIPVCSRQGHPTPRR